MSIGSIVISDILQNGYTLISPSVHGTTQSTNISFYIMYRTVQLSVGGRGHESDNDGGDASDAADGAL